jgi:hypothetical protein
MHPPPEQVPCGPHLGGIDLGLGSHATAEEPSDFLGVNVVVFGLAAMDRFHRERVSEDTRDTLPGTQLCQPIPGEATFDTDDAILAIGGDGLETWVWGCWQVTLNQRLPSLVQDAEVHGTSMQINAAVKLVLVGVEAHEVSSSFLSDSLPLSAYHRGRLRRGPQ